MVNANKSSSIEFNARSHNVHNLCAHREGSYSAMFKLANLLVFRKLREQMGLDQCRMCYTAAAPIMKNTLDFFLSLNVPVLEVFGMSESTGPHTVSLGFDFRIPSCGKDIPGSSSHIKNPDEDGNGEVFFYSYRCRMYSKMQDFFYEYTIVYFYLCEFNFLCSCASTVATFSWATLTTSRRRKKLSTNKTSCSLATSPR